MKPTYFTCTLGQASDLGLTDKSFQNINCFIEARAKSAPNDPAVGFAIPSASETEAWSSSTWTFAEVFQGSRTIANVIYKKHGKQLGQSRTVALICPSTPEFLFIWLALMRLGHAVLLVAPQCQPAAIAHLCKACDVSLIFYDDVYTSQCHEAAETALRDGVELSPTPLPFTKHLSLAVLLKQSADGLQHEPDISETDVAYLHHTSGTSSGVPKPIPQTHRAGAGVLPAFPDGREAASFTTTPLYHGGVADLFRAWASGALIWLFPGKGVPITARNICKSLDASTKSSTNPPVKYFSSVPYVLQLMEADERGLTSLQSMDVVGVGGAALPTEVGDRMVKKGINLISRFGSAECGFLMSSHRDYENDQDWQYLRSAEGMSFFKFEEREGGLSELVIAQGWPHMVFSPETFIFRSIMKRPLTCEQAKTNRSDGSYATADLFAPHKTIPNAWRYDSRADSQLTLITGKKFDPAPLEGAISTSELLEDVLIFGNGRPFPGALVFRSEAARNMSDADLREALFPLIERLNIESQDHARVPRNMVIPLPVLATPLEKSSKGTIIRGATEARFGVAIDSAYNDMSSFNVDDDVPDEDLPRLIKTMITSIVPKRGQLDDDTDLFAYGVDSVAGMQIRTGLRQLLPGSASKQLPLNVVEDCGTVARLAEYVIKQRNGDQTVDEEDEHQFMLQLVEDYSNFQRRPVGALSNGENDDDIQRHQDKQTDNKKDVIVLTGATGALGAHVLALYCQKPSVRKIYCLVRGTTDTQIAKDRVDQALKQRGLRELPPQDAAVEVEILSASLGEERLGLSDRDYERIAKEITIVMHVAWSVNFRMRLRSFVKDNISGELLSAYTAGSCKTAAEYLPLSSPRYSLRAWNFLKDLLLTIACYACVCRLDKSHKSSTTEFIGA